LLPEPEGNNLIHGQVRELLESLKTLFRTRSTLSSSGRQVKHIYPYHETVNEWIISGTIVQQLRGSMLLGQACAEVAESTTSSKSCLEEYALRHTVAHLAHLRNELAHHRAAAESLGASVMVGGSTGSPLSSLLPAELLPAKLLPLDGILANWGFIRRVFKAGCGHHVVAALAGMQLPVSPYCQETLRWLKRCFIIFDEDPDAMEQATIERCPVNCDKFKEAVRRIPELEWVASLEVGEYMGEWPSTNPLVVLEVTELKIFIVMPYFLPTAKLQAIVWCLHAGHRGCSMCCLQP
jgi:hypothetical protein